MPEIKHKAYNTGQSLDIKASNNKPPSPGMKKMDSMITLPTNNLLNKVPTRVNNGLACIICLVFYFRHYDLDWIFDL